MYAIDIIYSSRNALGKASTKETVGEGYSFIQASSQIFVLGKTY